MEKKYDIIVLGLGGIGSAVADRLSGQGYQVLGLEQYEPIHDKGSSHGETRIIRKAYFEDPRYVPLVLRAYQLWNKLQVDSGQELLTQCGCLIMSSENSPIIQGCLKSAQSMSLKYELLNASSLKKNYPFQIPNSTVGFFEPDGGYLRVEKCIEQFLKRAKKNGAEFKFNTPVKTWRAHRDEVEVFSQQTIYKAKKLIVCLGAWSRKFLNLSNIPLSSKRVVQYWFDAPSTIQIPTFFQETLEGVWIYGFPRIGQSIKLAFHNVYENCDPCKVKRTISENEIKYIEKYARSLLPNLQQYSHAKTCLYTMTPDEHFFLGPLRFPNQNVFLATGFSGHGFKFAPVIGEVIEQYIEGKLEYDIDFLNPYRFLPPQ